MLAGTVGGLALGRLTSAASPLASLCIAAVLEIFRAVPLIIQLIMANTANAMLGLQYSALKVSVVGDVGS